MKENLVLRAIDEEGRIVLPMQFRTELGIQCGDQCCIERLSDGKFSVRNDPEGSTKVDELGRIQVDGYAAGTTFEFILENRCITMFPTEHICENCNGTDTLSIVGGEILCLSCVHKTKL